MRMWRTPLRWVADVYCVLFPRDHVNTDDFIRRDHIFVRAFIHCSSFSPTTAPSSGGESHRACDAYSLFQDISIWCNIVTRACIMGRDLLPNANPPRQNRLCFVGSLL